MGIEEILGVKAVLTDGPTSEFDFRSEGKLSGPMNMETTKGDDLISQFDQQGRNGKSSKD